MKFSEELIEAYSNVNIPSSEELVRLKKSLSSVHLLIEEYNDGGSLVVAADVDRETIIRMYEEEAKKESNGRKNIRIGTIEVTNKRVSV